jgi:salicylate hydroxylase
LLILHCRGGGIGGLTLAVALSHLHLEEFLDVDLYESAVKLTEVGAGIGFSPKTWEVLKEFGMAEDLEARMVPGQTPPDHKPSGIDDFSQSVQSPDISLD